jgi:CubicO group peptidase (beta-lactamase class C family)
MKDIGGTVEPGFETIRDAFGVAEADDPGGAQLCIWRHGRKVVDLWTGEDPVKGRPFDKDTITILMSCTKGATAVCANILAERGLLDTDAPVARYWPEFAANGKSQMPVKYLLSHSAGLFGVEENSGVGPRELLKPEVTAAALARMEPLWEPGTASFYHFVSYGYMVGELIRRVSGKTVGRFFADEVAGPLKLDLWIGLPESEEHRVAAHFRPGPPPLTAEQWRKTFSGMGIDADTRLMKALIYTFTTTEELIESLNTREGHAVEIAAGNGIGNARSLSKMYAACIGEVDGVRLFNTKTMERARTPLTDNIPTLPIAPSTMSGNGPQRFGLGFELTRGIEPMLGPGSFGHAGAGGKMAFAHPESGFAVAYVCSAMLWDGASGPDARWLPWTKALKELV